jgi:diguanylate cyclase (GGDEF)-like protein/PAS domain S-box-containing protein
VLIARYRPSVLVRNLALCLLCVLLGALAAHYVHEFERHLDEESFHYESGRLQAQLRFRLTMYEQVLRAGASLFSASDEVTRDDWRRFIESFDIEERLPGLGAVAFAERLASSAIDDHEQRQRSHGLTDYAVWPQGARDEHVVVTMVETHDISHTRALGYDMYSNADRARAMDRARDEGKATLSARVTLASDLPDEAKPAVMLFVPVYLGGDIPTTVEQRRAALIGFICAPIRIHELLQGLQQVMTPGLRLHLADADGAPLFGEMPATRSAFHDRQTIDLHGRTWVAEITADDSFAGPGHSAAPYILVGAVLLSLMLWRLLYTSARAEVRAQLLARDMTRALRASEAGHRAVVESSAEGILTINPQGIVLSFNHAAERMFGFDADEVIGRNVSMLMPERFRARHDGLVANFQRGGSRNIVGLRREVTGLRRDGEEFPMSLAISIVDDDGPVQRLVGVIGDITESKRQQQFIRHLAEHDALTQLPNRTLLQDRLTVAIAQARRDRKMIGVMMIDLDHFKRINDSLGHEVGDQVLLQIAARLKACVRDCDSVARMGGDEFVILVSHASDGDVINRIASDVVAAVAAPLLIGRHELHVSASVGVSCYPSDGIDVATLVKNADTAMYHAKSAGRGRYELFSAEMMRRAHQKLELESAMRKALASGQFLMHYEPQICMRTGALLGAEALIRWKHPERGMISPMDFIPVAEDTGQIIAIGEWTLRTACAEARQMQVRLGHPLAVSVNLSPRQFVQPELAAMVESACRDGGLDPQFLILEITEGTLLKRSEQIIMTLERLRTLGVRVAVDDFGTGYSSLAYITRFPVDLLKIDRSFVRDIIDDPADAAIVNAIIAMAHSLGIAVVAEGVETAEQLAFLRERSCDAAQGWYFGKGMPAAGFAVQSHQLPAALSDDQIVSRFAAMDAGDHLF